ncbi:hypothetical protein BVRB_019860, partial [Beta vulgaris subsp. vulgaris]
AMQWAKELESRGRRRASRGGFQMDDAYEDAYMSAGDDDHDDMFDANEMEDGDLPRPAARSRGRGATPSRVRSSRKRSRAKMEEDDEGVTEKPRRSVRPGRYKVKFVMGSDDEVIHSREVHDVEDEAPYSADANMAEGATSAAESTDSDQTNERSGRSNR